MEQVDEADRSERGRQNMERIAQMDGIPYDNQTLLSKLETSNVFTITPGLFGEFVLCGGDADTTVTLSALELMALAEEIHNVAKYTNYGRRPA